MVFSFSATSYAQDSLALKENREGFDWNQRIALAEASPNHFNKSIKKVLNDINPEVSPNAHFGVRVKEKVQLGLMLKF